MLGACLRLWIAVWVVEIVLALTFASTGRLVTLAENEYRAAIDKGGQARIETTLRGLSDWAGLKFDARDEMDGDSPMEGARRGIHAAAERIHALLLVASLRVLQWSEALPVIGLCMVATAIDGLMVRRRRAYGFSTAVPAIYNVAGYLLISSAMLLPCIVVAPMLIPYTVLLGACVVATGALWLLCAHFPGPATLLGGRT